MSAINERGLVGKVIDTTAKNSRVILLRLGDIVVTSGTAQIFPVDLLVGKVAKVEKNRFFVLPFVDFENIDYLQIVTSK